jgi:hypothetical protein
MKQASFIIKKDEKLKTTNNIETNNENKNDDNKKTITSKKPIKLVENIYYFR